jgi:hypothetical protein
MMLTGFAHVATLYSFHGFTPDIYAYRMSRYISSCTDEKAGQHCRFFLAYPRV